MCFQKSLGQRLEGNLAAGGCGTRSHERGGGGGGGGAPGHPACQAPAPGTSVTGTHTLRQTCSAAWSWLTVDFGLVHVLFCFCLKDLIIR